MSRTTMDLWVGVFVAMGIAALFFLALKVGSISGSDIQSPYLLSARFDNIGGLKPKAAVKSAGVVVGRVEAISFDDKTFQATVHMSADAKEWKKQRLRARGVQVVEHAGDYAQAVAAGRALADQDAHCHFVDDEHSLSLLLGYAAAAPHLVAQLAESKIAVDETHPLFIYIPCGVGGAPGGVALGLQQAFGPHVHCFFAEPVQSPCFMVEMLAGAAALPGLEAHPSVYELGLNNQTEADGLAVPRASELAADVVRGFLGGVFTVEDETLFRHLCLLQEREGLQIEPSAAAGFGGPRALLESAAGQDYLQRQKLLPHMASATHIVWTTGGLFVPDEEYARFLARGRDLSN